MARRLPRGRDLIPWTVERHGVVASTQETAAARAAEGAPEGTVVVAAAQSAGRGRLGRAWASPPGGLYATLLLRPPPAARIEEIPLVAGLALAEAVEAAAGVRAEVKWPNDLLVEGRKVGGILAEGRAGAVLLGVGVNCGAAPEVEDAPVPPGGLGGLDGAAPAALLDAFLDRFSDRHAAWRTGGLAPLLEGLEARLARRGARVRWADGASRGEGTLLGLAADGALRLETPAGERRLRSGEILPYT